MKPLKNREDKIDEQSQVTLFLEGCRAALGADRVQWEGPENSTGTLPRTVVGVVEPATTGEVQTVVWLANHYHVPLFPISTGKNWGFGSAVPVKSGACLLSLRRMKRIREINLTFGYAVVEPGVTQGDLAEALQTRQSQWALDVTGAGRETSLVGNALERGIAYHSQRTQTTRNLELVLGDGTLLATGFQDPRVRKLNHLYTHGVGPDPMGLFHQSRFGVVTAMTIDLMPVAETHASVSLNVESSLIPRLVDVLRQVRLSGAMEGVPHIANRARFFSTMVPLMVRRSRKSLTPAQAEVLLLKVFPEEWTLLTSVRGPRSLARVKSALLKRALKPLGRVWVMTPFMRLIQRVAGWFLPTVKAVMDATESVQNLPLGVPSDDPQHFLDRDLSEPQKTAPDPDRHPRGFLYLVPLMAADGESARRFLETLPHLAAASGQEPAVTLNALDGKVLEAVVSLTFDKADKEAVQRLMKVGADWLEKLKDIGAHPYRVHIDHMEQAGPSTGAWAELQKKLTLAFDPNNVLSHGRYDFGAQE
ncbi:MAG: FAD-binding oxidoreductase [Elusimicrobia bacterium]|nr:FAD-binding oxidoreductase [Elusimicrobiota bacterium]